jgi:DNA uptake protein ComE-like DNA-binding protein
MNTFKSLFLFHKRQQRGIFILIIILLLMLAIRWYLSQQPEERIQMMDTTAYQAKVDSIKLATTSRKDTIYPFNPNYINDYRGYMLGLKLEELERLSRFRESGKFINSSAQFQQVTQVSDQWLDSISPYFKFPSWVNKRRSNFSDSYNQATGRPTDINSATLKQLQQVYGIGPALSGRIIKERDRLGQFIDISQVRSIYGLSDSTMIQLKKRFYVKRPEDFKTISLNTSTKDELLTIPYFNDYLVNEIIKQRTLRDGFTSWEELFLVSRFPEEKLPQIKLYLTLD